MTTPVAWWCVACTRRVYPRMGSLADLEFWCPVCRAYTDAFQS